MRHSQLSIPDYSVLLLVRGAHCVYLQWQLAGGSRGNRSVTVPSLSVIRHLPRPSTFGWADSRSPPLCDAFPFLSPPLLLKELSSPAVDVCPYRTCIDLRTTSVSGYRWLRAHTSCELYMHLLTARQCGSLWPGLYSKWAKFLLVFANYSSLPPAYRFPDATLCRRAFSLWWFHHASSWAAVGKKKKKKGSKMNHG